MHLLLVDDDETFCRVLGRALERRGFEVEVAHDTESALARARARVPTHAVVDLRLQGSSGLRLVPVLRELSAHMRVVVLTGYASITTAVDAIKLGATHYLPKPADADQIVAAFDATPAAAAREAPEPREHLSVDQIEWEHIQRVLADNGGNVSATARSLGMYRRTLQRKLAKRAPRRTG
jgi:two-component system response regulator RegA